VTNDLRVVIFMVPPNLPGGWASKRDALRESQHITGQAGPLVRM